MLAQAVWPIAASSPKTCSAIRRFPREVFLSARLPDVSRPCLASLYPEAVIRLGGLVGQVQADALLAHFRLDSHRRPLCAERKRHLDGAGP